MSGICILYNYELAYVFKTENEIFLIHQIQADTERCNALCIHFLASPHEGNDETVYSFPTIMFPLPQVN